MGYKLRVRFAGICAFVPDYPFFEGDQPGKPTKVAVLLPDLVRPTLASWVNAPKPPVFRAPHISAAWFSMASFDDRRSIRGPDLIIKDPVSGKSIGVIILDGDRISFPRFSIRCFTFSNQVSTKPRPNARNSSSLWWLPRIAELSPQHAKAQRELNPFNTGALSGRLRAAIKIEGGHLSVDDFNRTETGSPKVWRFCRIKRKNNSFVCSGPPIVQRAIGNRLALTADLRGRIAEIEFLRSDGIPRSIFLRSRSSKVAKFNIGNMELESLFNIVGAPFLRFGASNVGDSDFEALYELAGPGFGPVPALGSSASGNSARPCAPGSFGGFA